MTSPTQADLFGDEPPPPTAKNLRIVRQSRKALSKAQASFNKLLSEVQRLQNKLTAWQEFDQKQQQRVGSELIPLVEAVRQARGKLIKSCAEILEGKHGGDLPKKAERRQLTALVLEVCETYFAEPGQPEPEVIAIFDAYSPVSHAEYQRVEEEELREDARNLFGVEIPEDIDFDNLEEFMASAFASLADQDEDEFEAEPKRSRKQKRSRQAKEDASAVKEAVSVDPKRPLRDVYRKLASALHPDRGIDEEDRNRRHELMARVNAAYEGVDLLALLELQLEIQQIDEDHVATIPETQLHQYNQVLRGRVARLKDEISAITDQFRMVMREHSRSMTPAAVERDFAGTLIEIRGNVDQLQEWASALRQTAYRKAWLKDWAQEKQEEERRQRYLDPAVFFDEELSDAMSTYFGPPAQSRGKSARGKRKRKT